MNLKENKFCFTCYYHLLTQTYCIWTGDKYTLDPREPGCDNWTKKHDISNICLRKMIKDE